jgi:hypothetical protein
MDLPSCDGQMEPSAWEPWKQPHGYPYHYHYRKFGVMSTFTWPLSLIYFAMSNVEFPVQKTASTMIFDDVHMISAWCLPTGRRWSNTTPCSEGLRLSYPLQCFTWRSRLLFVCLNNLTALFCDHDSSEIYFYRIVTWFSDSGRVWTGNRIYWLL